MSKSATEIAIVCDQIKELLLSKNMRYGDSALNPSRIFSKADATEQLLVRIDDKLSRIQKGAGLVASDEDVVSDLIGYLILLKIALANKSKKSIYQEIVTDSKFNPEHYVFRKSPETWDGTDIEPVGNNQLDRLTIGHGRVEVQLLGNQA